MSLTASQAGENSQTNDPEYTSVSSILIEQPPSVVRHLSDFKPYWFDFVFMTCQDSKEPKTTGHWWFPALWGAYSLLSSVHNSGRNSSFGQMYVWITTAPSLTASEKGDLESSLTSQSSTLHDSQCVKLRNVKWVDVREILVPFECKRSNARDRTRSFKKKHWPHVVTNTKVWTLQLFQDIPFSLEMSIDNNKK